MKAQPCQVPHVYLLLCPSQAPLPDSPFLLSTCEVFFSTPGKVGDQLPGPSSQGLPLISWGGHSGALMVPEECAASRLQLPESKVLSSLQCVGSLKAPQD